MLLFSSAATSLWRIFYYHIALLGNNLLQQCICEENEAAALFLARNKADINHLNLAVSALDYVSSYGPKYRFVHHTVLTHTDEMLFLFFEINYQDLVWNNVICRAFLRVELSGKPRRKKIF